MERGPIFAAIVGVCVACTSFSATDESQPDGGGPADGGDADAPAADAPDETGKDVAPGAPRIVPLDAVASGIALDADFVYWSEQVPGTLWKASLTTGDKTTLYPTTESPQGLALVGGTLFWVDNGHHLVGSYGLVTNMVTRKGLDTSVYGDGPPTIAVAANAGLAIGIPGSAGGSLLWIDTTLTTIAPTYSAKPYSIATSPTGPDAFWTDNQAGAVYRASYDQGSATIATLAAAGAENNCESIAASADSVYWTTFSGGGVRRAPIDTGAVEDVAVGESNPQSLAADDTGVYWLTSNGTTGELRHRGPHDGAPKTIFTGLPVSIDDRFLTKIALSPTHIAWYGGTSLYVLRK